MEIFGQTEAISCHRFWPDKWPQTYQRTASEQNYVGVPNPLLASTVVKTGGENVSSLRVEAVLHQHAGVAKAAVVGLPHERWGEAVTAVVIPDSDQQPTETDLIAFCHDRLAGFETPKRVLFVDALPETVGGKVLNYRLREQYAETYH